MQARELQMKSIDYRRSVIQMIKTGGGGHTGGSLSCVDILNVLYNHVMNVTPENFADPDRDRYIQSKGHSVEALYAVLADKGFFPAVRSANAQPVSVALHRPPDPQGERHRAEYRGAGAWVGAGGRDGAGGQAGRTLVPGVYAAR